MDDYALNDSTKASFGVLFNQNWKEETKAVVDDLNVVQFQCDCCVKPVKCATYDAAIEHSAWLLSRWQPSQTCKLEALSQLSQYDTIVTVWHNCHSMTQLS